MGIGEKKKCLRIVQIKIPLFSFYITNLTIETKKCKRFLMTGDKIKIEN